MDVSVGHMLKGLPYLPLTLWLLRDVCCTDRILFLSLSGNGRGNLSMHVKGLLAMLEEWAGWCAQKGVPNNAISATKLADFMVHLFRIGLVWHTVGNYHSGISAFLEPHHLHKVSDHPTISKLMCHFYLQHPSSHKCFDPSDVEHSLSLLESWAPASFPATFKLPWKTAAVLALVTAKHCSDLILLCIGNQHLFLQHHATIFIPMSGGKMV